MSRATSPSIARGASRPSAATAGGGTDDAGGRPGGALVTRGQQPPGAFHEGLLPFADLRQLRDLCVARTVDLAFVRARVGARAAAGGRGRCSTSTPSASTRSRA